MIRNLISVAFALLALLSSAHSVNADQFFFSTGDPDGKIGTAARPDVSAFEIESADDFILSQATSINHVTFTGLLVGGDLSNLDLSNLVLEIYRVFPADSDVSRTSGAPTFSTSQVPTRVNSPSDVAFDARTSSDFGSALATDLGPFTVSNSVVPGGIHPIPGQTTGGDGPQTGLEVLIDVMLSNPFTLPADHYFFVPQVEMTSGFFLWLSAPKPIVAPGTPFLPDLQSWTRDQFLDPDWLRVGTDIVGPPAAGGAAPTFNAVFTLQGETVPEPSTLTLLGLGGMALLVPSLRRQKTRA
jgi:PEP-CTERM motif